jgi:hypothetical protein
MVFSRLRHISFASSIRMHHITGYHTMYLRGTYSMWVNDINMDDGSSKIVIQETQSEKVDYPFCNSNRLPAHLHHSFFYCVS